MVRTEMEMDKKRLADIVVGICNDVLFAEKGKTQDIKLPELSADEWNELLQFAANQGVLPIIAHLFADLEVEDASTRMVMVRWFVTAQKNRSRYYIRLQTMREMAAMFAAEGMDIMFLKGATLAQLYPNPEWRVFSDIDYYLYGESDKGIEVMKNAGIENSAYYHHHTQASLHDILLENHYDFVERVNHKCDIVLDDALKALAEKEGRTKRAEYLGNDVKNAYVMTPSMNALFLMRHMSAHFVSETMPLRMIYDWILFLKHNAQDVEWELVKELYVRSGMMQFASIIQQLIRTYMRCDSIDCPITSTQTHDVEKVWKSMIYPPKTDPYRKFSLKYYMFEARTFLANKWKHKLVYKGESYGVLFLKYAWLAIRKMTGRL